LRSPLTSFNQIAKFCTDYPETKVKHHLDFVNGETWSSLWQNGLLALAHYRHCILPRLYRTNTNLYCDVKEPGLRVAKEADLLLSRCDNYEIHPHDEPFNEDTFRRGIEQEWYFVQEDLRLIDGGVKTWVNEVKRGIVKVYESTASQYQGTGDAVRNAMFPCALPTFSKSISQLLRSLQWLHLCLSTQSGGKWINVMFQKCRC
jgi:hypothetical protein